MWTHGNSVYRHFEMVIVWHEVPFPATIDQRSPVAGHGTKWEAKNFKLASGGKQWDFLNFLDLTAVKKIVPKWRKKNHWWIYLTCKGVKELIEMLVLLVCATKQNCLLDMGKTATVFPLCVKVYIKWLKWSCRKSQRNFLLWFDPRPHTINY